VALPIVLSQRAGMMISPKVLDAVKAGGAFTAVGTGPFTFSQYNPNDRLIVTRNANYWVKDQPYLDKVTEVSVREPAQMVNGLRTGDFDMSIGIPVGQLQPLKDDSNLKILVESTLRYNRIYLNCTLPPLQDVRVRQALNYAIDRSAIMESEVGKGLGEIAWMPVPKAYWAFGAASAERYPYDPDKAKQLLQQAGYTGQPITMGVSTGAVAERRAEVLKQFWGDVGLNVNFQVMDAIAAANKYYFENGFNMLSSAWGGRPDPDLSYRIMFSQGGASNPGKCGGTDLDALINAGAQGQTQPDRAKSYQGANDIITAQALEVPLFFDPAVWAWRANKVQNITWQLTNTAKFHTVWVQ
jgi:peptide/nickel transport system permease protein/peptide/nickel transport system substrate-binding protein